ncbi:MAG: TetR/AcrR family transcriptional regulator [Myxococcota bacterium]
MAEAAELLPSRRERRRLEIRERIIDTAIALFESQGYEATTVNEIATQADIAYGTFFNHFPSKLDLLQEISDQLLRTTFEGIEEVSKRPGPFSEQLVRVFEDAAARALEMGPRRRELLGTLLTVAFPERAVTADRRFHDAFREFLSEGLASGGVRDDVDLDTLSEVVVGSWYSMFLSWVHFDDYPLAARVAATSRFLADSLRAKTPA